MKKWSPVVTVLLLALLLLPTGEAAAETCALLSRDIPPYNEALAGFREAYPGKVHRFVLEEETQAALAAVNAVRRHPCPHLLALGSRALKMLKIRVNVKPIIYAMILNPQATVGAAPSITGVHLEPSAADALAAIRRVLPKATRVGILYTPALSDPIVAAAQKAARSLRLEVIAMPANSIGAAIRAIPNLAARADVLWMIPDAITASQKVFEAMLAISFKRGIPLFALSRKHVSQGALAALFTDYRKNGRQAAEIVLQLEKGKKPNQIPSQHARGAGLVLNLGTATKLGLSIPEPVQRKAVERYR